MPWRASLPEPASRTRQPLRHANADPASTMGGASPRERSPARRPRSSPAATGRPSLFPTTGASLAPSARRSRAAARALTCPPASAGTARDSSFRALMRGDASCCNSTACTSAAMSGSTASIWARGPTASPPSTTTSPRTFTSAASRTSSLCVWTTRISPTCAGTPAPESIATPGSSTPARSTSSSGAPASQLRRSPRRAPPSKSPRVCAIR